MREMTRQILVATPLAVVLAGCVNPYGIGRDYGVHTVDYQRNRTNPPGQVQVVPAPAGTTTADGSPVTMINQPIPTGDDCHFTERGGQESAGLTGNLNPCGDSFQIGVTDLRSFQGQQIGAGVAAAQIAANQQLYGNLIAQGKILGGAGVCAALVASGVAIPAAVLSGVCLAPLAQAGGEVGGAVPDGPLVVTPNGLRGPGTAGLQQQLNALKRQQDEILKRLDKQPVTPQDYERSTRGGPRAAAIDGTLPGNGWYINRAGYARHVLALYGDGGDVIVDYVSGQGTKHQVTLAAWHRWLGA